MAVFLTGDTHGRTDFGKVEQFARDAGRHLTRDDYLIILGDFGFLWHGPSNEDEVEALDWLEGQTFTTLFLDGNHENFDLIDALPVTERFGGRVQDVRPHVTHLMRGERYEIGGHSFFVVGGGHSIDRKWRTPHVTWWEQEVPDDEERARIAAAARGVGHVDFVLTHVPPTGQYQRYRARWSGFWGPSDEYTDWLEENVEDVVSYDRWFFGHLHFDTPLDEPHTCLFNEVFDLDGTGLARFGLDMGSCPDGSAHRYAPGYEPPAEGERHGHSYYECVRCHKRLDM